MTASSTNKASHFNLLDHFIAYCRYKKILKYVAHGDTVLDVGCGFEATTLHTLTPKIKTGIGIDISLNDNKQTDKIKLVQHNLNNKNFPHLPMFDIVICLAVLEHIHNPYHLLSNIYKSLRKNGRLLLTTPSWNAKPILEFMAFKLKIISCEQIEDHKRYFNKSELISLCKKNGFSKINHSYFEFSLNNFILAIK